MQGESHGSLLHLDAPLSPLVAHEEDGDHDRRQRRDGGEQEEQAVLARRRRVVVRCDETQCVVAEERADDRARVIHRAVEAEGESALFGRGGVGDHGVARGAADALAEAVGQADGEDLRPGGRQPDERAHRARQTVAEDDETFAPPAPVAEVAGEEFEEAGERLGPALYDADGEGRSAEREREEERQDGVDELARSVVEEAHQPDGEHVARQSQEPRAQRRQPAHPGGRLDRLGCRLRLACVHVRDL